MDVSSNPSSPYVSLTSQDQNQRAMGLAIETFVDFVIHGLLRIKRKRLKLHVAPELIVKYRNSTAPIWAEIEEVRVQERSSQRWALAIGVPCTLLSIALMIDLGFAPILISALVTTVFVLKPTVRFKQKFVAKLAPKLLDHLPNFRYQRYGYIPMADLNPCKLIPVHAPDLVAQEDYFKYNGDNIDIELVECSLAKHGYNKGKRKVSKVFAGLIVRGKLARDTGTIAVMQYSWGRLMSSLQDKPLDSKYKLEFDEAPSNGRYHFYAEDEAFARQVFTPELFHEVSELIAQLDVAAPEISICGQQVVLLLHRPKNLFNAPGLSSAGRREEVLTEMLQETLLLEQLCKLIEHLARTITTVQQRNAGI